MRKLKNNCKIVANEKICPKFYRLCLDAKPIGRLVRPGQFIHIRITDTLKPFFRRPFSVYRAQKYLEIIYEVVGEGTGMLASMKKGKVLDVVGPLGNSFSMPSKDIKNIYFIAGGVGVAPFLLLSDFLAKRKCQMTLLYGGRTQGHVFDMKEFKKNGCAVHIATDNGSVGVRGRVSELFNTIKRDGHTSMIYTCGPKPMIVSVKKFVERNKIPCEASLEEVMACGLGVCLGCATKTKSGYKTVCHDGPVFDINEVF